MSKLIYGIALNDADYVVQNKKTIAPRSSGKRIQKQVWICPYYKTWMAMLSRCYAIKRISYQDKFVCPEWLIFSNFKSWMEKQDWEGKELDKDLLIRGNKVYSVDTCIFISRRINCFLIENESRAGKLPRGVRLSRSTKRYEAQASFEGSMHHLGTYDTPEEAHKAWLIKKNEWAELLAEKETNPLVAELLKNRFKLNIEEE